MEYGLFTCDACGQGFYVYADELSATMEFRCECGHLCHDPEITDDEPIVAYGGDGGFE